MKILMNVLAFGLCLSCPMRGRADNDASYFMGTTASLTGGSAVATSGDPASVWYNPAGLATITSSKVDLMMSVFSFQHRPIDAGLSVRYDDITRAVDLSGTQTAVVSPSTAFVYRLGDVTVGAGLFITGDESVMTAGDNNWFGGGESQRLDAQVTVSRNRYHGGVALGGQLGERIRVGAGLFGVYESSERSFDFAVGWEQPDLVFTQQFHGYDEYSRFGLQLDAGVQVVLSEVVTLGLLLRGPSLLLHEGGRFRRFTTSATTGAAVATPSHGLEVLPQARERAQVGLLAPARAVVGLVAAWSNLQISAEAEVAHGLRSLPVTTRTDEGAQTTYLVDRQGLVNGRAGLLLGLLRSEGSATLLGFGVFSDRNASAEGPQLATFAVDYYGLTAGVQHETSMRLDGGERAERILFRTSLGLRYAFGSGHTGQLAVDLQDPQNPRQGIERIAVNFHEVHLMLGTSAEF